jgi:replication-associated recombination protein RarA
MGGGETVMAKKVQQPPDPWQRTTTEHGFFADEVISALQKSIRRAMLENAVLLGWEMYLTSEELEEKLWSRLCVIAVEDIGLGNPQAPVLVETLYQQHQRYPRLGGERFLFAAHAIRVLATSAKDRASDDLVSWARHSVALGERLPEIPDFALDMHTRRGQEMGRDYRFFMEEASRVEPGLENRGQTWRDWIIDALDKGKIT